MSDDVSQFLQQVEELKGRRIEEDEARSRELEERILQERSERAARRAVVTDNLRLESPSHRSTSIKSEDSKMDSFSNSSTKENESGGSNGIDSKIHDESQTMRSFREPSTPSWQRRPSQSPDKHDRRARPLSVLATENAYARSNTPTDTSVSPSRDKTLTKDQIAQALGSKDSNWFRQTADRGANSAAYRRNQVEDDDRSDVGSSRKGLPGMVPEHPALPTSPRHGILDLAASPKLDPPSYSNNAEGLDHARPDRSPTGRMASNRPISPTKGLGGFVQSAMMKRSDSVKRWSVTSPAGLARAESIAANRTGSRPNNLIRDIPSMPLHKSHPSSRQSSHEREKSIESPAPALQPSDPIFDPSYVSKISVPNSTDRETQDASKSTDEVTPPSSPSKAMDTRRWSPTKASWLETALNKPESPKKTHTPSLSQPAWMVELNKAKAHKTGGAKPEPENTKGPVVKHEVKIGGLMRNIPMGSTVSPTPVSGVFPPPTTSVPGSTHTKPVSPTITAAPEEIKPVVNKPSAPLISSKPKPELPPSASSKVDFRSTLKTRKTSPSVSEGSGGSEELKAVFGSLRKTTTQNYVAPDELKNTILKGKSGLVFTGGPKKSEIKDEFKQDILKKRESFKQAQQEGRGIRPNSGSVSRTEAPEGLEKFKQLGRGSVVSGSPFSPLSKSVASPQTPAKPASFSIRQNMQSVETATNKLTQKVQESVSKPKAEPPTKAYGRSIGGGLDATLDFTARSGHATPPPKTISAHATGNSSSGTPRSLTKPAMDAAAALSEFFGDKKPQRDYHVDTADILMKRPQASQVVKTHALKLFQLSGDGRQIPVLPHNERILFEQEMYICIHSFVSVTGGSIAQVYFWAGDDVPAAEVEDAQVFANREAKAADANLIRMAQGRETAEFIDALGGVLIIRRGSSNRFDSLSPSMLCGRKHLGQVIFDEIDFSSANLCSGFPYLISKGGRCVLWKGKGSDVQELSCARLIGMDLTLMGELEEVDDGHEPESLWSMFNGSPKPHSADHWRLKPNYDMYSSRLFKSDASTKQQIIELSPFNQADLEPTNIYVIDAFFEMYIIVGAKAQTQYASFRNALDFAQEYAILASGMEDRPFVPISTVVLEGIPRDLKGVFRKWSDDKSPTAMASAPESGSGLKRARSLRIVPLSHALQAFLE
ncbi:Gelsolin [Ceratocystis platani]|uniref:Gelsolin n=1 Tax=Ceratocystis fimbriata f. sp. platani TaxID=88771 RepID=A0A0F8D3X0_CERFI|nr:Gelsolin [Ceratocystis platani]